MQVTYDFSDPSVKLRNRELGGLLKGAKATNCDNLTLVMMKGEKGTDTIDGHTIRKVFAVDWLLGLA